MIFIAMMLISGRPGPLKSWPQYCMYWNWFANRHAHHINNAGFSFHRLGMIRRHYRYILIKDRMNNPQKHLKQRAKTQGLRKLIKFPPKPANNIEGHPLFTSKRK